MGLSKNIAYRLRTLREAAGLSQQEVADRADLSLSLIAKMEQGRKADPRASTILTLAAALNVRPGQLIEDLTPPPDGFLPGKGKKGKKKKKRLAALLTPSVNGETAPTESHEAALAVAPDANGHPATVAETVAEKPRKKKKKKEKALVK